MRHLKGTLDYGLKFEAKGRISIQGYADADWACDYCVLGFVHVSSLKQWERLCVFLKYIQNT